MFAFEFFLSPTENITGFGQEVQPEDPGIVQIQIQPTSHFSRGELFTPHFYFSQLINVFQSPTLISINLMKLIQDNSLQQLLPQNSQDTSSLLSSVLVDPHDCFEYKIFLEDSLTLTIPNNQIKCLFVSVVGY